ncbi:type II toxin-antitoxin system PemK/MazF family toxin [Streptococcus suis]|uniref:hypothetical protein n=1 Tax=Streptococcus suis TaxID=1307 RepID=UPI00209C4471|nr:hypothetical protein [Streptococcus suis]MCO8220651.1 hypothetical protein [Streptococcus suis]
MDKQEIETLCDDANKIFKKESQSSFNKTRHLPTWLYEKALLLRKERRRYRSGYTPKYKVYPRGALIFVNFGVNIGAELSNYHWAIVLNNFDSPKSPKLTVIPISSKSNKFSVKIDGLISKKSEKFLTTSLLQKQKEFYSYREKIHAANHGEFTTLDELEEYFKKQENYFTDNEKIKEVAATYQRYNKTSYAMCKDITTISKDKVMAINEFDPCGKIKVSSQTLDAVEEKIRQNIFKNL